MATQLPDILHVPSDFEGSRHDVVIPIDGANVGIPVSYPIEATRRAARGSEGIAWRDVSALGYGEVISAYRALKTEGEQPTAELITQRIRKDTALADRIAVLSREASDYEPDKPWFDGRDNTCKIALATPDRTESSFFDSFCSTLFRSRIGIALSNWQQPVGIHHETIEFPAERDWARGGIGIAAIPFVERYFPEAKIEIQRGFDRIPLPGHPDATPSDGLERMRGHTLCISSEDLPDTDENPEAWAGSLAMLARNFFEWKPPYPEAESDPEFASLLESMRQAVARKHQMREAGRYTYHAMDQVDEEWDKQNREAFHGQRVTIIPLAGTSFGYTSPSHPHSEAGRVTTPYTRLEGFIARVSASNQGEIRLVGGLHTESEPNYIPEEIEFGHLWIDGVFGGWGNPMEDPESAIPAGVKQRIAITAPSDRELPDPGWYLEQYI